MAHDPTGTSVAHAEDGKEGLVMAWGHWMSRRVAEIIGRLPFLVTFVRSVDSTGGKAAGGILRSAAGFKNFKFLGPRWNAVLDTFVYEIAGILEKDADRPIEDILGAAPLMGALGKKFEDALGRKVWLVLEQAHDDKECTIFKALAASESYNDKDGKEHKKPSKHAVTDLTLARALKEKSALCPKCFPEGTPSAESAKGREPSKKKASPAEICGQYILEAQDDEEREMRSGRVERLWRMHVNVMDQELSDRLDGLNTRAELEMLLLAADKGDQRAFEAVLSRLEEPGLGRSVNRMRREISKTVHEKLGEINAACQPARDRIREDLEAARRQHAVRKGRSASDAIKKAGLFTRMARSVGRFLTDLVSSPA